MINDLVAVKELWSITAKHGGTQNRIYGFSGGLDKPYDDAEPPMLCIFSIVATDSGKEMGYIFNNAFEKVHSWARIRDYIGGGHRKYLIYLDDQSAVKNMILSLYSGESMGTKHGRSKTIIDKPRYIMEDGTEIYDLRIGNLFPPTAHVPMYGNGYLAHEGEDIRAHFNGRSFFTEYDPLLYAGLCASVTRWKLNYGTREKEKQSDNPMLVCMVSDSVESIAISFAEIIYQYHHNVNGISMIDPRKDGVKFAHQLIQNHRDMMDFDLVCDHLTENRANNYSWALAMVPNNLNATFGERSAVAKPYFFYTVWDKKSFCYLVNFGFNDGTHHWHRQYSFLTLYDKTEAGKYLYKEIYSSFRKKINPEYADTEDETYLRYWGDPIRAYDKGNPLTSMLKKSKGTRPYALSSFCGDDIANLPII